jgi:membrane associated rhomboid family serine protease
MFPLRDENPTELVPLVTLLIIATNVLAWLLLQGAGAGQEFISSLCAYGTIPGEITGRIPPGTTVALGPDHVCSTGGPTWATVVTSMFMHGGWGHLIGNMWFLWVFGNNIEDSMGHVRFVVFYLLCGAIATAAHVASGPGSGIPTVGASGAISGVMGAYLVLYPSVRVHTMIFLGIFVRIVPVAAWVMLLLWFGYQVLLGSISSAEGGGVAFWAHAGGFLAGVVLIKLFAKPLLTEAKRQGRVLSSGELGRFGPW